MISVLVVDDSALIRALLSEVIEQHPLLDLVGAAPDAYIAKQMVNELKPDVITLDIEMPKVNGLVFLDRLMKARPTPVVMFSSLTQNGTEATIRALELGAVDFIAKPIFNVAEKLEEFSQELTDKIVLASQAKLDLYKISRMPLLKVDDSIGDVVIAIGASTGGTEALKSILLNLPVNFPPILIVQHMPAGFTTSFAARLNGLCSIQVKEAIDGEKLVRGCAYIAPGDYHMKVRQGANGYSISLDQHDKISGHRPSVDVLFASIADQVGQNAIGVIMTGMGKDGASGLKHMRDKGARTLAQSEDTCVVFGMPQKAIGAHI